MDLDLNSLLRTNEYDQELIKRADAIRREFYGNEVYIRGLIEISNYCKNNCYYCGIRAGNLRASRYRMTENEILDCCKNGYELGFRTYVLQGGEDLFYSDKDVCQIVYKIKEMFPDCAVTLSIGERDRDSYMAYFKAGADRYLLRHETATENHYIKLHPADMSLENRKKCLYNLKDIGFQVGAGFMVGSPFQTVENIIKDIDFLKDLQPDMIGIGPFIPHCDTPFKESPAGTAEETIKLISILRILFPSALIPATTALGTIAVDGRLRGLQAGANVVMPNLTPKQNRDKYSLYNNKLSTGAEAVEGLETLKNQVDSIGYHIVVNRGDVKKKN